MLFERGGGEDLFSASHRGGWVLTGAVGAGLIRMTALTRRQTASIRACLKEQYLKCKCSAQLTTFVASNRCNYAAVYARNIMHSSFRRKLSLLLIVSCYPS